MRLSLLLLLTSAVIVFTLEDNELRKNEIGFLYSMPKTLLSGKNETVCLSIHHASSLPAKIMVDLKIKEKHFYTTRTADSDYSCFDLHVPKYEMREPQVCSVRVQVQLNGVVYSAHSQDPVVIYPSKKITFVESDRGMYKAGERVKLRILTLEDDLLPPSNYKVPQVRIRNPLDIAVIVWENVSTELGLAQLDYQLPKDAVEGKWRVEVGSEITTLEVNKYVLPRFKVEIIHPKIIYFEAPFINVKVCSKYSHGGNVKGTAFLRMSDSHNNMKPVQAFKKLLEDGCAEFPLTNDELSLLQIKALYTLMDPKIHLQITATVTEYGTDKIELANAKTLISLKPYSMKLAPENVFLPGLPYEGRIQLGNVHADLSGEVVEICYNVAIKKSWNYLNNEQCTNFTVANEKSIQFHILSLKSNVIHLHLYARSLNHTNVGDSLLVVRLFSQSSSYVVLEQARSEDSSRCKSVQQFTVKFTTDNFRDHENVTFYYMLKTRGKIYKLRQITHSVRKHYPNYLNDFRDLVGTKHKFIKVGSSLDKFILKFKLDEKIISTYHLLVYYITSTGEIVAASKEVEVTPCLNNQVKANWSHKQITPGGVASLLLETKSDSLCSISAVDKSLKFIGGGGELNARSFLKPFLEEKEAVESGRKTCVPPVKKSNREAAALTEDKFWDLRRKKRFIYSFSEDYDTYDIFNKFGVISVTNFKVVTKPCYTGPVLPTDPNRVQFLTDQYDVQNEDKITPIRSFFPETWLWELVPVRGAAVIHRNLPHSVTNWVTDVVCVSETDGVGFSPTTEISSFQPFFVDVLTPHSVKKGEVLYLHVVVFNYLNYNIPVRMTLGESAGLQVDSSAKKIISHCVNANDSFVHVFELKAVELGKVNVTVLAELDSGFPRQCGPDVIVNKRDIVLKTLTVEPEGTLVRRTKSVLLCTDEEHPSNNVTWDIEVPDDVMAGTAKAQVVVNADLLGQTIENLEELVSMPTGCGEQIMATLAPNLYALRYLNATNSLTSAIRHRILRNLKIGYQRILNYVHKDGSFSAFGYHDGMGSMFLTTFVVRTLQEARGYIYVDQRVIDRAVAWILEHQLENGCFSTMLHVFQDMGGTSKENSTAALTAYVMISLLEANIDVPEATKTNAKYCIRGYYHLDKYTLAISSYALFKVGWYSEGYRMLKKLMQISKQRDNMLWWSNRDVNSSSATDVEITSYVLLSFLNQHTQENLAHAHSVVRWLSTKQGPRGGFKSTQDTVVALDALSKYSRFLLSKSIDLDISIETKDQEHVLKIREEDRLKAKRFMVEESGGVKISTKGQGCLLVQLVATFYVKQHNSGDSFKLDMEVLPVSSVAKCSIARISPCFSYNGPDNVANMAILEIDLPSGYEADRASLYKLIDEGKNDHVKKFEELDQKVVLYFTKLDKNQICVNFDINENSVVQFRSNSSVRLYDYYKPEFGVVQFYGIAEKCGNLTTPEIIKTSVVKRDVNRDFVNVDVELEEPEGVEGNAPVFVKPNSTVNFIVGNSLERRRREGLNPDFVDKGYEMQTPEGVEGNVEVYVLPNITDNHL